MLRTGLQGLVLLSCLSARPPAAEAQDAIPPGDGRLTPADVPHTTLDVTIDGVLDDPVWRDALVIELGIEVNPRENVPADVETLAYIIEDGSRLLVAFDARDPAPEEIRAYLRDRDSAFSDDFVGVVLDTFNDERRAVEFFVNALGVQMDLTVDDVNGGEDSSWDALWDSAGAINGTGYAVEMSIPYSQLRFEQTDRPQTWGIDVLRVRPRENRALISAFPRERGRNCYLCQTGKVRGFSEAEPGRGLEVVPSLTASRTDMRDPDVGGLVNGDVDAEVGLNVRWGISSDLIAILALNPDFSQVEADVAQLDVNNQFALYFPETRPFFLEGQDFFSTPIEAVFTRTIADPDVGAKLTGTRGANSYGVFAAEDTVTNLLLPGALGSSNDSLEHCRLECLPRPSRTFVGRYRRDVGDNSMLGALITSRSADGYRNRLAGFDGRYRPTDRHSIRFQVLRSSTEYPDDIVTGAGQPAGTFEGDALQLNYNFSTREWFANANYAAFDPEFRADAGFVTRVDVENRNINVGRVWQGEGFWFNRMQLGANANSTHDTSGQMLGRNRNMFFNMQMPRQSFLQINASRGQQYWDEQIYDTGNLFVFGEVRALPGMFVGMQMNRGRQIDFANSRLGEETRIGPNVTWNATRHLLFRLQYTTSKLETESSGERIFDAEVVDFRATWQFNLRSFLRLTAQQQVVDRNLALFDSPGVQRRSKTRGTQLLYSYRVNPQTVFYLGYADNRLADDASASLTETDRTFFTKFSYAWVP